MPKETLAIAPIRLARSPARLVVAPLVVALTGGAAIAAGAVLAGSGGIALVVAGALTTILAVYMLLLLLSVRLDVEVSSLHLHWLGGSRHYLLARGPVTRVTVGGRGTAIRARFGAFGWALGQATLRGSEPIDLVRLAATPTVILVPTDRGRLGIAPASEAELLAALSAAARVQQRLDEVATHSREAVVPIATPIEPRAVAPPSPRPRLMTGIERTMLEQRLAAERAAALAAAEDERQAAAEVARQVAERMASGAAAPVVRRSAAQRRVRVPTTWRRPAWLGVPREQRWPLAATIMPAVVAGILWLAALVTGRVDLPEAALRPVVLALMLSGPAAALAAFAARAWFPRLGGLVVVSGLMGLVLTGRALFG
jgi:hypothetical protein